MNTQQMLNIVQILNLFFLIIYVIKTWEIASATKEATFATQTSACISEKTLKEMKQAREQELSPNIMVYCEVPIPYDTAIYLIIKNVGKSTANDVKICFDPMLRSSVVYTDGFCIKDISFLKDGIKSMPSGYEIRTILDYAESYFSSKCPLRYEVNISYINSINNSQIKNLQIIDLLAVKQLKYTVKYDISDLVKEVKELRKCVEKSNVK